MSTFARSEAQQRWQVAAEKQAEAEWAFVVAQREYERLSQEEARLTRERGYGSDERRRVGQLVSGQAKACAAADLARLLAREEFVAACLWLHGVEAVVTH